MCFLPGYVPYQLNGSTKIHISMMSQAAEIFKDKVIMKFTYLVVIFLCFSCIFKANASEGVFTDFSCGWLHQYNTAEYNLKIHPFKLNDTSTSNVEILWDMNSDGIVNLHDLKIINKLDMDKMVEDMEVLKQTPLTSETFDSLVSGIYLKEKNNGISDFKLFKILLLQSGFDVLVNKAQHDMTDFEVDLKLMWAKETESGWIKILWQDDGLFKYKYTYQYLKQPHRLLNSLVGHWEFDEKFGTMAADSSDFSNPATLINGTGRTNSGNLSFDGTDDYVKVADSPFLDIRDELTISVKVYMDRYSTDLPKIVIKPCDLTDPNNGQLYAIDLGNDGTTPAFILSDGIAGGNSISASDGRLKLSLSKWHHIVGTYDGSAISLYVDGKLVNTTAGNIKIGTSDLPLCIGGRMQKHSFKGMIDDLRIYNKGLTEKEVMNLYNK